MIVSVRLSLSPQAFFFATPSNPPHGFVLDDNRPADRPRLGVSRIIDPSPPTPTTTIVCHPRRKKTAPRKNERPVPLAVRRRSRARRTERGGGGGGRKKTAERKAKRSFPRAENMIPFRRGALIENPSIKARGKRRERELVFFLSTLLRPRLPTGRSPRNSRA